MAIFENNAEHSFSDEIAWGAAAYGSAETEVAAARGPGWPRIGYFFGMDGERVKVALESPLVAVFGRRIDG